MISESYNEFISIVNRIHKILIEKYRLQSKMSFGATIDYCRNRDSVVKKYYNTLDSVRQLRNVLVHQQDNTFVLANPSSELIDIMLRIEQSLISPKSVGDYFKKNVISFTETDSLYYVLEIINGTNITQFPVFTNNGFSGIISATGITHWLADNLHIEIDYKKIRISEIVKSDLIHENYELMNLNSSIFKLDDIFNSYYLQHKDPPVIILTNSAKLKSKNDIQGIITFWDMNKIDHLL